MSGLDDDDDFFNDIYAEEKKDVKDQKSEPKENIDFKSNTEITKTEIETNAQKIEDSNIKSSELISEINTTNFKIQNASTASTEIPPSSSSFSTSTNDTNTGPTGSKASDLVYRSDGNASLGNIVIPPKDEGKMFIGGLNWETTDESLTNYFSQFGEVLDCTVMRDHYTGKSRGFGFLTFRDPKCVNTVMAKEHYLDGKIIDPKRAIPREEQDKTAKIFVGGVGSDVTEEDYKTFFEQYGTVIDAQLMIDKDSGRPRGFGFVTFDSDKAMDRILAQPLLILKDKPIEVKRAENRAKDSNFSRQTNIFNTDNMNFQAQQQNMYAGMTPQVMSQWWTQYMAYMQTYQALQQQMANGELSNEQQQQFMQQMQQMQGQQPLPNQQSIQQDQVQGNQQDQDRGKNTPQNDDAGDNEMRRLDRDRDDRNGRRGRGYNNYDRRSRSPPNGIPTGPRDNKRNRRRDRKGYHPYGKNRERNRDRD